MNNPSNAEKKSGNNKWILLIIPLVILKITNPDVLEHRSEVNRIINSEMAYHQNESEDSFENLFSLFGNSLVRSIAEEMITTNDYHLITTTILNYEGVRNVIGVGVFGNVFIFAEAEQKIRNLIQEKLFDDSLQLPPLEDEYLDESDEIDADTTNTDFN